MVNTNIYSTRAHRKQSTNHGSPPASDESRATGHFFLITRYSAPSTLFSQHLFKEVFVNRTIFTAAIIAFIAIVSLSVTAVAGPVPDTGQTQSYTNTFGEDSDYSCNPHSYTDLGNGVVKDNVTGLEWQQATASGTYTWQQAIDYCNNLSLGGKDDWRLPTIKELTTLVDSSIPYPGPTINATFFPGTVASSYWSSTTYAYYTYGAWGVLFLYGYVDANGKTGYYYVRAVRGGQ